MKSKTMKITGIVLLTVIVAALAVLGYRAYQKNQVQKVSKSTFALDTIISITLYGDYDESLIDDCFDICTSYEDIFSTTLADSELYRLNHREISTVSDPVAELIKKGIYYSDLSGGSFDIAIGSLTSLWDFTAEDPTVPDAADISEAIKHVDYKSVTVNGDSVTFSDDGTMIDLGAIAKGYIADRLKDYLVQEGVESAIINLGGNVLCIGSYPYDSGFTIGIQYPFQDENSTIATVKVSGKSVVTSGVYQRYFEQDGVLYHHILDPNTGYPYENGLSSVTIISDESVDGDALSTVCFSLGLEKGLELINGMDGIYAIFVTDDDQLHFSDGLTDAFSVSY